jgi:hypothetical protein
MFRTGASGEEMTAQLHALERPLEESRSGHILKAYRESQTVGVAAGLTNQIERLCVQACSELRQTPAGAAAASTHALKAKSKEAREQWLAWHASAGLSVVTPDLVRGHADDDDI